jgi:sugar-phosphatase
VRAGKAAGATVIAVMTSHAAGELDAADVIVPGLSAVSWADGRLSISD